MNNIISLSGGKDSTAMLLMMLEKKIKVDHIVFFDTGWEFPEMYEHIDKLEKYIGSEIIRLKHKIPFDEMFIKYGFASLKDARRGVFDFLKQKEPIAREQIFSPEEEI